MLLPTPGPSLTWSLPPSHSPLLWEIGSLPGYPLQPSTSSLCHIKHILSHWGQTGQPWRLSCLTATNVPLVLIQQCMFFGWYLRFWERPELQRCRLCWFSCGVTIYSCAFFAFLNSFKSALIFSLMFVCVYLLLFQSAARSSHSEYSYARFMFANMTKYH